MKCSKCKNKRLSFADFVKIERYNAKEKNDEKKPYICSSCGQEFYKKEFSRLLRWGYVVLYIIFIYFIRKSAFWLQYIFKRGGVDISFETNFLLTSIVVIVQWLITVSIWIDLYILISYFIKWKFQLHLK